ncbi:putative membrane protein, partial [Vibrio parahaemolyticus Peru-288]
LLILVRRQLKLRR